MHKKIWILLVCLLAIGVLSAQEINWIYSPDEAFETAKKSGKIIFTDVFTTWCHWCKKLDQETFVHPTFKEIAPKFVLLKVDGDVYPAFRRKYGVTGYPTMLFLNGYGEETHARVVGFRTASELVPIMKEALSPDRSDELQWYTEPQEAFNAAKSLERVIFCDVFTTWCHWCKKLDQETFSAPSFQQEARRFVLLKVDGDVHPDFVSLYGVKGYPTMLFLNKDGQEIRRVVGFKPASELVPIMKNITDRLEYSLVWMENYEEALAECKATGKPIFAWASMKGCYWCDKLEKETFSTPGFMALSEKFVLLKAMRETNPEFVQKYSIKGYPQMLFLNATGQEFYNRIVGYVPAEKLLPIMEEALKQYQPE